MSFLPIQRVLDTAIQSRFLDTNAKKVVGVGLVLTALHVASALAAVALNARHGFYQNHFSGEYKPTTPLQYAFKDLGTYLMLSRVINKISSLFKTQTPPPQLEIRAVSWNLSSINDLKKALEDKRALGDEIARDEFETRYEKASIAHMNKIIDGFGPDIILMQELAGQTNEKGRYEHTPLLDLLRTNGYRIYAPGNGPAVAFKEKVLNYLYIPDSLREGSACIVLEHHATGQVIRAVSDHLAGFNSKVFNKNKDATLPEDTQRGDQQLFEIAEPLRGDCYEDSMLVIYGLDSNTTPPGVFGEGTLHPHRLSPLLQRTFARDEASDNREHATIVDHNSKLPLKFDHIFCWHPRKMPTVARQIQEDINGPELLQQTHLFTTTGSDHLPVAAIITLSE